MVSITFAQPLYLWFLFAVPFLIVTHFFLLRHSKHKAMKFANFAALKRVTGERFITKNYTILFLRTIIIIGAILAVSQVTIWYQGSTNENEYVVALDTSASMTATDIPPTRLEAAKIYGQKFVDSLDSNTRVGLVSFSGVTFIEQIVTTDRRAIADSLKLIDTTAAGTDIPGALITSTNMLTAVDRGRAVILISDGSNTIEDFHSKSLERAINYVNNYHVKVYAIGVGSAMQSPIGYLPQYYNVSATYNEDNLKYIANMTGGRYYKASDEKSLQEAYDDIKATDKVSTLKIELTSWLTMLCLALILLEWVLISTRFRSLP